LPVLVDDGLEDGNLMGGERVSDIFIGLVMASARFVKKERKGPPQATVRPDSTFHLGNRSVLPK
jgi:hypothetical protein